MSDADLLRRAITASGLSARRFAEWVLTRDERTIRRWVSGQQPVPGVASSRLRWLLALSSRDRDRLVAILSRSTTEEPSR